MDKANWIVRKAHYKDADYYPTPPWCTRALFDHFSGVPWERYLAWEPACGSGHMSEVLRERMGDVIATDLHDYGQCSRPLDFLHAGANPAGLVVDWVITNPPFNQAAPFALKALSVARVGVAFFCRVQFLESARRYHKLFSPHPLSWVAVFSERCGLHRGMWVPGSGGLICYAWFVWAKEEARLSLGLSDHDQTRLSLIPPGQEERLTLPTDARFVDIEERSAVIS